MAVKYLDDGNDDGTVLGQSTSTKLGSYGVAPVDQPASADQAALTVTAVTAVTTSFVTATNQARINQVIADLGALETKYNAIRAALVSTGWIKGAA
jgi:hypothetical protein